MLDLSQRANLSAFPEKMDQPCSFEDLRDCLRDIAKVNRLTFAYRPTLAWLDEVCGERKGGDPLHIVDVGCGYGDGLRRIHQWARERGVAVRLTGIDLNPDAIRAARTVTPQDAGIELLVGNAYTWQPESPVDIVLSSLLTHHLEDAEVVAFLRWMEVTARVGWFVNDLHREEMPYRLFRLLAACTTWHPFVKHDGPVSILRSFRSEDWTRLCAEAGLPSEAYAVRGYRPARLCVSRIK